MNTNFLITDESSSKNEIIKKKIINYYTTNGDATIADVSCELELSIPTITKLIGELIDDGFILDYGKQDTSSGRKPNIYGLNPESGYFIGVDVLRDRINIAATDFKGGKLRVNMDIPYSFENTREALDILCQLINDFINRLPINRSKILAAGVNIPGRVNPVSGYSYSFFYFEEKPLSQLIEEKINIKTFIENDTRAMTYGEYTKGVAKGEKDVLFINITWGLGLGMIINGQPYYGKSGFSGELGHICMYNNEVLCHCGKKGCLETEASGSAFYRYFMERYKDGSSTILKAKIENNYSISLMDLIEAVQKEDIMCIDILEQIGNNLGRAIAGMINVFNPELVVLGGTLALTSDYISLPIKSTIRKYSLNLVSKDTEIKMSKLGERAGIIGACMLSRSKILGIIHY